MKRFPFLLLDAGPIIKLFELGIWDTFTTKCHVTIARTVAEKEVVFASKGDNKEYIDFGLASYEEKGLIEIIDVEPSVVSAFYDKFNLWYKAYIDDGEKETLAFLFNSPEQWLVCSADHAVFRVLAILGKAEQGISLEELLNKVGLSRRNLEWKFTKRFREKYTRMGKADSIQGQGLL
jgi:hypothetical protein